MGLCIKSILCKEWEKTKWHATSNSTYHLGQSLFQNNHTIWYKIHSIDIEGNILKKPPLIQLRCLDHQEECKYIVSNKRVKWYDFYYNNEKLAIVGYLIRVNSTYEYLELQRLVWLYTNMYLVFAWRGAKQHKSKESPSLPLTYCTYQQPDSTASSNREF